MKEIQSLKERPEVNNQRKQKFAQWYRDNGQDDNLDIQLSKDYKHTALLGDYYQIGSDDTLSYEQFLNRACSWMATGSGKTLVIIKLIEILQQLIKRSEIPTLEAWKALYDAAVEFRKLAPWAWMSDADIFGVQNHKTGEIGYCCILGELGEFFGLSVYSGSDGLDGYLKLQNGEIKPEDAGALYIQNCLMVSFENKSFIEKEDMKVIKETGLQFKGRKAWPLFRRYLPGYFPWFLSKDEALYMTDALNQAMDVCLRLKDNNKLLFAPGKNQYLVRVPEVGDGAVVWKDEWRTPDPVKPKDPVNMHVDEIRLQKIKNSLKQTAAIWEIDFFLAPTPVMEGGRPFFPQAIMIADHDTGFVHDVHLAQANTCQEEFSEKFLSCMERTEAVPLEILVRKKEDAKRLEPFAMQLNIKLSEVKNLQNIDNARRSMLKFFNR